MDQQRIVRARTLFAETLTMHLRHHFTAEEMREIADTFVADASRNKEFGYTAWADACMAYAEFMRAMAQHAEYRAAPDAFPSTPAYQPRCALGDALKARRDAAV